MQNLPIYLRACQTLSQYGVHTLPVRLAPILERSGIHWFDYQAYADSLSISSVQVVQQYGPDGFTNYFDGDYMVFYNPSLPPKRMRFTLAHELGHIFLGHIGHFAPLCACAGLTPDEQADLFASYLLCPPLLLQALKVNSPQQVAAWCDVSLPCAKRAFGILQQTRQTPHACLQNEETRLLAHFAPFLSTALQNSGETDSLMPPKHLGLARRL